MKYHLFSFIVCHKEDYQSYFKGIKATFSTAHCFYNASQFTCCFPISAHAPQPFLLTCLALTESQWRTRFSSWWNSILNCLKALPLALLFDWGECSKRGQQNTHCPLILPLTRLLRPIPKTCQGEASVDRLFGFILLKIHHAVLGQSPASDLGIKEEMKFKHKCNNKNQHKAEGWGLKGKSHGVKEGLSLFCIFLSHFK